ALPSLRRPRGVGRLLVLQAGLLLAIAALGTACMFRPSLLNNVPKPGDPIALTALAVALVFYGLLLVRAQRTYRLTRRGSDLGVVVGLVWLAAAVPPALLLTWS